MNLQVRLYCFTETLFDLCPRIRMKCFRSLLRRQFDIQEMTTIGSIRSNFFLLILDRNAGPVNSAVAQISWGSINQSRGRRTMVSVATTLGDCKMFAFQFWYWAASRSRSLVPSRRCHVWEQVLCTSRHLDIPLIADFSQSIISHKLIAWP